MPFPITENLITDLKRGKEEVFTMVFKDYFPKLCRFSVTYVLDETVAKNIVQDTFLKFWEARSSLNEKQSIFSYLLTITKNSCLDYLKHKHIEHKYQNALLENYNEVQLNYNALKRLDIDLLDYQEIEQIIDNTLKKLPPQCQLVFRLSRIEDMSNNEIAEKLEISVKAVEANITRAIKIFRKELKDYITILVLLNLI